MAGLQETLEAQARARGPLQPIGKAQPAVNSPIPAAITGTNTGMVDSPMAARPNTYYVPNTNLNAAGWTRTDNGDVFVTGTPTIPTANITAHEAAHSRFVPAGGMVLGKADYNAAARSQLAANMKAIQPDQSVGGQYWGALPNRSAEEQIANLAGYEGALPAGQDITQSPIAPQLFTPSPSVDPGGATAQQLKNYYFHHVSQPYQGVWEGQVEAPSAGAVALSTINKLARSLALRLGMNVGRQE